MNDCPRGQSTDDIAHRSGHLVHRIIEGQLVCLTGELALDYAERIRQGFR